MISVWCMLTSCYTGLGLSDTTRYFAIVIDFFAFYSLNCKFNFEML